MERRQDELGARLWQISLLGTLLGCPGCRNVLGPRRRIFLAERKRYRKRVNEYVGPGLERVRVLDSDESG